MNTSHHSSSSLPYFENWEEHSTVLSPNSDGAETSHPRIPPEVPGYTLIKKIANGPFCEVYLAEDQRTHQPAAVKVTYLVSAKSSFGERFLREWNILLSLNHPQIVRCFAFGRLPQAYYMATEYINGLTLEQWIGQRGPMEFQQAALFLQQAAQALEHIHRVGIVHRDIKPSNLMALSRDSLKLIDFGMSRLDLPDAYSITLLHEDALLGTADYMAPEQAIACHDVDGRADIYALGCTFYFLLTGRPPFSGGTVADRLLRHRRETAPSLYIFRPDVPEDLPKDDGERTARTALFCC